MKNRKRLYAQVEKQDESATSKQAVFEMKKLEQKNQEGTTREGLDMLNSELRMQQQ